MMSSLGSVSATSASLTRMLSRLDTDSSGTVNRDEFVAGRPKGTSAEQSASLFDKLDSSSSGAMSLTNLASAFQQMSSQMQATMLQAQEAGGNRPPDPDELFSKLDSDGDGAVTKEEFLAGKPDDVSDEQASTLWSDIAGDSDSVSQEQLAAGMPPAGPPPGGAPGGAAGGAPDSTEIFDALDTNQDGIVSQAEFLAGKPDDVSDEQASALWTTIAGDSDSVTQDEFAEGMQQAGPPSQDLQASQSANELIDQLLAAIDTYRNTAAYASASSSTSVAA